MLSMVAFWGVMSTEIETLEQQQTEKIETEVGDVDRIQITKVYACCPWRPSGWVIRALQSDINI